MSISTRILSPATLRVSFAGPREPASSVEICIVMAYPSSARAAGAETPSGVDGRTASGNNAMSPRLFNRMIGFLLMDKV